MENKTNTNVNVKAKGTEGKVRDEKAPLMLKVTVTDETGKEWASTVAPAKDFKTGSVGYYLSDKITNPESGKRYQVGMNIILIGSKG
jgi:hypothetical protein